jgi:hypothetical protein
VRTDPIYCGVGSEGGDELLNRGDLCRQSVRPCELVGEARGLGGGGGAGAEFDLVLLFRRQGGGDGCLVVGPEPADEAAFLFRGPLVVEGDEAGEDLLFERVL